MSQPTMKIYLAGPEVFLPFPLTTATHLKETCKAHNATGLFPLDNTIPESILHTQPGIKTPSIPSWIRLKNMDMIRSSDGIIANMTPFRGPSMDVGTAYEMGVAAALGKVVVGYSTDRRPYRMKVIEGGVAGAWGECGKDEKGVLMDGMGMAVEDFEGEDLVDNLMMACGIDNEGGVVLASAEEAIAMAVKIWNARNVEVKDN